MSIYQHFREEERPFIDSFNEWKLQVSERFTPKLTDFLDPRQQTIVQALKSPAEDLTIQLYGGYEGAERKRALIIPPYWDIQQNDFGVSLFNVSYPKKFVTIEHRHLLGSIMALGLKREKFGDILISDQAVQVILAEEIADYVRMNLTQVGRATVSFEPIQWSELIPPRIEWDEKQGSVTSLRLDVILSEIYNLSRSKAGELIRSERVKVNWKVIEKPSYELTPGDDLSVRGFGRSRLLSINGETRRGNLWLAYAVLK